MSNEAKEIMPTYNYWGNGIVLMTQKEYHDSCERIKGIHRQLKRAKQNHIALHKIIRRYRKENH